ncbi:MAG: NAD-dependent protein deacylase [Candidatus Treponema excrementipullorum]|nr:NAD-dependent protein deacylase [Candidatus Treponema excrementipullorum]MDY4708302.1 NAD-dependent protein deacylase [Candidatus Treponema excrementipullorum]
MDITEKVQKLQEMVDNSSNIVFFGGAGVSTESGIPDFRSQDGLYNQQWAYPPEQILSGSFFKGNISEFYRFYRAKMLCLEAKPNAAHYALAKLEEVGKLTAVITQNIDGLHQAAGSKVVYELHGSVLRNYCMDCGRFYDVHHIVNTAPNVPRCTHCGGIVKPDVVLYEEGLDENVLTGALQKIAQADTLIIGGTSLNVYPAASLINYFRGNKLVVINKSATSADAHAQLLINEGIAQVMGALNI